MSALLTFSGGKFEGGWDRQRAQGLWQIDGLIDVGEKEKEIVSHTAEWFRVITGLQRGCGKNYSWAQSGTKQFSLMC